MQYQVQFTTRTLTLPPLCLGLPIGRYTSYHVPANRSGSKIDTERRGDLADGLGRIAKAMTLEWMIAFLSSGRLTTRPSDMTSATFVTIKATYRSLDTSFKEYKQYNISKILNNAVEDLSIIVYVGLKHLTVYAFNVCL